MAGCHDFAKNLNPFITDFYRIDQTMIARVREDEMAKQDFDYRCCEKDGALFVM